MAKRSRARPRPAAPPIADSSTDLALGRAGYARPYVSRTWGALMGEALDQPLARHVLFVGPSGSGKSMRVRCTELALARGCSDAAWRDWTIQDARLLRYVGNRQYLECNVTVTAEPLEGGDVGDAGGPASQDYKYEKHEGTPPVLLLTSIPKDDLLPMFAVRAALTGAPDTAYDWIVTKACRGLTLDQIVEQFPIGLRTKYTAAIKSLEVDTGAEDGTTAPAPVDALFLVGERAGQAANQHKRTAADKAGTVATLKQGLGAQPTDEQVDTARSNLNKLQQQRTAFTAFANDKVELARIIEVGKKRRGELDAVVKARDALAEHVNAGTYDVAVLEAARKLAQGALANEMETCPFCGVYPDDVPCDPHMATIQEIAAQTIADVDDVQHQIEDAAEVTRRDAQIANMKGELDRLRVKVKELQDATRNAPPQVADATYQRAEETYRRLDNDRSTWRRVRVLEEEATTEKTESEEWKRLADGCTTVVQDFVRGAREQFILQVNAFMPRGFTFHLDTEEKSWGIVHTSGRRKDVYCEAPSGGQGVSTLSAVGAAAYEDCAHLTILAPEERNLDPELLAATMRALSPSSCQIFLSSVVMPKRPPKGWLIVNLDDAAAAAAASTEAGTEVDPTAASTDADGATATNDHIAEGDDDHERWYHHPESDSWIKMRPSERGDSTDEALLVEVGTDAERADYEAHDVHPAGPPAEEPDPFADDETDAEEPDPFASDADGAEPDEAAVTQALVRLHADFLRTTPPTDDVLDVEEGDGDVDDRQQREDGRQNQEDALRDDASFREDEPEYPG
jgi:hypothetical protein